MAEKFEFIKEVYLNNNCPFCYNNDGLYLTVKQKTIETSFYKAITPEIKYDLACKTCKSTVYPVNWTDDMERIFEYHKKAITPKNPSTQLKKTAWLAILSGIILAICIVAFLVYAKL
jgi:hypothetical protein